MNLEQQLLARFATDHPAETASALAAMSHREAALVLGNIAPAVAAGLLHYLSSLSAALALEQLSTEDSYRHTNRRASRYRRIHLARDSERAPSRSHRLLSRATPSGRFRTCSSTPKIRPAHSWTPAVPTAFEQETVRQVLERVQRNPEHALYYLYVVADNQQLVGVVNMRELMSARSDASARLSLHAQCRIHCRQRHLANRGGAPSMGKCPRAARGG